MGVTSQIHEYLSNYMGNHVIDTLQVHEAIELMNLIEESESEYDDITRDTLLGVNLGGTKITLNNGKTIYMPINGCCEDCDYADHLYQMGEDAALSEGDV